MLKRLKKRRVSLIAPRETLINFAAIHLIGKYHSWLDNVQSIQLLGNADYVEFVDIFELSEFRNDISDDDLEIQDGRTHMFVFSVDTSEVSFRSLVVLDSAGSLLSICKI